MDNKYLHEIKCGNAINDNPRDYSEDDDENDEDAFSLIQSALRGSSKLYRLKFARGIRNLDQRLQIAMTEASDQLLMIQRSNLNVKYYISLHCTFYKAADPDIVTDPPAVFNSGPLILLPSWTRLGSYVITQSVCPSVCLSVTKVLILPTIRFF